MGGRGLNMCNTLQLKHTVSETEGTGKAEIMERCCYVCTEQTEALYTGNCTLICIIQEQHEKEGERKRKKNKMRQEKARGKGTEGEVFFQVV